jgi:hypothetical protein
MLIYNTLRPKALHEHAGDLREQCIAAVNLSSGLAAHGVFAKSCGLDLHPSKFPVRTCTRTRLAQQAATIDYVDVKLRFEPYVAGAIICLTFLLGQDAAAGFGSVLIL